MFPPNWDKEPVCAEALDLQDSEMKRSRQIAYRALGKYPRDLLDRNLNRVYFLSFIAFYNMTYGGSNAADRIYLTNNGVGQNYSDKYIERLLHAELSSVLLRNYPGHLDLKAWKELTPKGFSYGRGGRNALSSGTASEAQRENYYKNGFLSQYAQSSIENDFNAIAKHMFCPTDNWQQLLNTYPALRAKYEMVVAFYHELDPVFSKAYFSKLGTQDTGR